MAGRFICSYAHCDKSFSDLTKFKEHNRTHQSLKPFHCRYGRCTQTSSKKGNLRRHIRQVHKNVPAEDADQYIEEDQQTLEVEQAIYAAQFCTRNKRLPNSSPLDVTPPLPGELLQLAGSNSSNSFGDFDSDFDSSNDITNDLNAFTTTLFISREEEEEEEGDEAESETSVPLSATLSTFTTIYISSSGRYLCPFPGGCSSGFYDVSHLKIHYRVHTSLLPYRCIFSPADCKFVSTRKGNVVRHIRARHLLDQQQQASGSSQRATLLDPFDFVKTRTAWIKWEDGLFERAEILPVAEHQKLQKRQQQKSSKKKSSKSSSSAQRELLSGTQNNSHHHYNNHNNHHNHHNNHHNNLPQSSAQSLLFMQSLASASSAANSVNSHRPSGSMGKRKLPPVETEVEGLNCDWSSFFSQI